MWRQRLVTTCTLRMFMIGLCGVILMLLIECRASKKGDSSPTGGILNPGFEICNDDPDADFWQSAASVANTATSHCYALRKKATGFMPSQGAYFMELRADSCVASVSQPSIDLTGSAALRFDWSLSGTVGGRQATAKLTLGTGDPLWIKSYATSGGKISDQKLGETVQLGGATVSGKMTIAADTTAIIATTAPAQTQPAGESGPMDTMAVTSLIFQIDNLQVCSADGSCIGDQLGTTSCGSGSGSNTTGAGGSTGGTASCATGSCYNASEGICCSRGAPYACKGKCYASTDAAMSAGGCTDFRTTCY